MDADTANAPAYVPYDTFDGFVARLKQITVPSHIHKSLMPNISGALQSHLLSALKFLGLIGPSGEATDALHTLVNAYGTPAWKPALAKVIDAAYKPIIGDFSVKNAIPKTLKDRFETHGNADGATMVKSIRFYLKALRSAGVEVSPHLKSRAASVRRNRTPGANGKGKAETEAKTNEVNGAHRSDADQTPPAPEGTITYPLHFKGKPSGSLIVPADMSARDVAVVELMIPILKAYAGDPGDGEGK